MVHEISSGSQRGRIDLIYLQLAVKHRGLIDEGIRTVVESAFVSTNGEEIK
jgi:hypothetical protein